ncbi:hypothetical protein BGZ59_009580 [Podila verticillata]|nr:hypothetical protein BGZ59_009580 [Podila verticillata]
MDQAERIDFSKATIATTDNSHICTNGGTCVNDRSGPAAAELAHARQYHPSIAADTLALVQGRRRRKSEHHLQVQAPKVDDTEEEETRTEQEQEYDDIPLGHAIPGLLASSSNTPPPLPPQYEIHLISSPPTHPVLGSYGLFALTTLRPGTHLLDYISLVAPDAAADPDSDHTLYLHSDLNLDASLQGNHGRFVNDFRGIRTQAQGPNVAWDLYRDAHSGQVRMGCKVLKRIAPGEEILCTYGKAYWKSRGVAAPGPEWEDGWDTDLEDSGSEEE